MYNRPSVICYFLDIGFFPSPVVIPLMTPKMAQRRLENHTTKHGNENFYFYYGLSEDGYSVEYNLYAIIDDARYEMYIPDAPSTSCLALM